ncbi:hypothetical protein ACS126_17980 [Sphingobacterium lactis]|uniref:hypothetical protein n=1 Tax=Sphingobacterium lactis TaxID=797291 RepID=UPI003EC67B14
MGYNTKYILKYCNKWGTPLRVEIQLLDYIGETFILVNNDDYLQDQDGSYLTSAIDGEYDSGRDINGIEGGANPFTLNYQNDTGEKGGAIRATFADMEFFENLMFNIDDLATSDETEIRCAFYYNDNLEWIGFVTPDFFNVEITENPLIRLTASDRIGVLKDVDYELTSSMDVNVRIIDIVLNILKLTGLDINLNIICGLYSDQFQQYSGDSEFQHWETNNPFYDTWVNEYRLVTDLQTMETMDCYEVLQKLLNQFNCLLTQHKGEWWIINKYDLDYGKGVRFVYNSNGEFQLMDRVSFDEKYFGVINSGGERTIIPAGAKNTYLLDYGKEQIYPRNNDLISPSTTYEVPDYWFMVNNLDMAMSNQVPIEYNSNGTAISTYRDEKINVRLWEKVVDNPNEGIGTVNISWNAANLESQKFKIGSITGKTFDLTWTTQAIGRPRTGILLRLCLIFEDSDSCFVSNHLNDGQGWYYYKYSEVQASNTPYPVVFFEFNNEYNDEDIAVKKTFTVNKTASIDYLKNVAIANGATLTDESFENAKMFVKIYPAFTRESKDVDTVIRHTKVEFKNDNQTPKGTVFQSMIEGKFTKPTKQREVLFGDYQTFGQNGFFYKNREDSLSIQYNNAGDRLKDWFTPYDQERNPLLIHSLRQLTYSYGRAHDELKIGFDMDRIDPFARYSVRCFSERYIQVNPENDYLQENNSRYITTTIGKYLNSKRFVFVEGKIDYLRSHFEGVLAQIRTNEVQRQEYIYSYFEQGDIS